MSLRDIIDRLRPIREKDPHGDTDQIRQSARRIASRDAEFGAACIDFAVDFALKSIDSDIAASEAAAERDRAEARKTPAQRHAERVEAQRVAQEKRDETARQNAAAARAAQETKDRVDAAVDQIAKTKLGDLIMPNNKCLRDCTGPECIMFGGWLKAVGLAVPDGGIVGDHLSEAKLWKLRTWSGPSR